MPQTNYSNCFVVNGIMSLRALGDTDDATTRFYEMTKDTMNDASMEADLPFDGSLYYYGAEEEKNVIASTGGGSLSSTTIVVLMVLLSVGVFALTVVALYLLIYRIGRTSRTTDAPRGNGRLGICAVNYLGSAWLEVKSTSSGSCSSETSSASGKGTMPKIVVRNSASSVSCSSVSELSARTPESCRMGSPNAELEKIDEQARVRTPGSYRMGSPTAELEKIDEEAQSVGSASRRGANLNATFYTAAQSDSSSKGDEETVGEDEGDAVAFSSPQSAFAPSFSTQSFGTQSCATSVTDDVLNFSRSTPRSSLFYVYAFPESVKSVNSCKSDDDEASP